MTEFMVEALKRARRLVVAVGGFTVLLLGVAFLVLPGPSLIIIALGLGILASEFVWARRLLNRIKRLMQRRKRGNVPEADRIEDRA